MRSDDDIALDIGRSLLQWMRNPVGVRGTHRVMGDDKWAHGYDVTIAFAPPPKCLDRDCEECR